jgi:malonate transporter
MSSLPVIVDALVPIVFVILLGILAGCIGLITREGSGVLSSLALDFCMPALLFSRTATMSMAELQDWGLLLGITLGLLSIYLLALVLSLAIFRKPIAASSL